jgi:hypothetical protein
MERGDGKIVFGGVRSEGEELYEREYVWRMMTYGRHGFYRILNVLSNE